MKQLIARLATVVMPLFFFILSWNSFGFKSAGDLNHSTIENLSTIVPAPHGTHSEPDPFLTLIHSCSFQTNATRTINFTATSIPIQSVLSLATTHTANRMLLATALHISPFMPTPSQCISERSQAPIHLYCVL